MLMALTPIATAFGGINIQMASRERVNSKLAMADVEETQTTTTAQYDPEIAKQFKIVTCSSTSCSKKRKSLGFDEYETYAAFYNRIKEGDAPDVQLEEVPCLGACKNAPCVAVQHEDYVGTVGLIGMTDGELNERLFHNVLAEEDYDRVWSSVENGIQMMTDADDDDED